MNNERYITVELEAFEKDITSALDKLIKLEREIFTSIATQMADHGYLILDVAKRFAHAVAHDHGERDFRSRIARSTAL